MPKSSDHDAGATRDVLLMLGEDFGEFGDLAVASQAAGRTAAAISVGSDAPDGVRIFKGDYEVPNEDAVLAIDMGARTLIAVADAHHGFEASHELLAGLCELEQLPSDPLGLFDVLLALALPGEAPCESETTLAVAVVDREVGRGFGVSFGDSSLVVLGREGIRLLHRKSQVYVSPWSRDSLDPRRAAEVSFAIRPGEVLVGFTDGVDECHYGRPETSLQPDDLLALFEGCGAETEVLAEAISLQALEGVDGNPGGQDNLGVVVTAG